MSESHTLELVESLPVQSPLYDIDPSVAQKFSTKELALAFENTQFQYDYPICGKFSLNQKGELEVCKLAAGVGTAHIGTGRCYIHEGINLVSTYGRSIRGDEIFQGLYEDLKSRKLNIQLLNDELAVARAILANRLTSLKRDKPLNNTLVYNDLLKCIEQIRKVCESMAKIQLAQSQGLTLDHISNLVWQIQQIIDQEILDQNLKSRMFNRIATECGFDGL